MQLKLKLTVAAAIACVAGMASAQDTQVVKIGHVAPMSGAQSHYGKTQMAPMAIEDLNPKHRYRRQEDRSKSRLRQRPIEAGWRCTEIVRCQSGRCCRHLIPGHHSCIKGLQRCGIPM
jgi:hypothetical protein